MIDNLAKQYKQTGVIAIRDTLFNEILPIIKEKAKYVYWYKAYKLYDRVCQVRNLYNITEEDILQDLCLDALTWIEKFNGTTSFSKYLFASLWNWKPKYINKEAYVGINTVECKGLTSEEKDNFMDSIANEIQLDLRIGVGSLMENVKCPNEKAILKMLYINPDISKNDMAKVLGVSKGRVSQIFANMKGNKALYEFIKNEL